MELPRDRFKREMEEINKKTNQVNGIEEDDELQNEVDQELENLEMELEKVDKNMGSYSEPVTMSKEEYDKSKEFEMHNKALAQFKKANVEHLSNEDKKDMQKMIDMYKNKELENPILKHLMEQKGILSKEYIEDSEKVGTMYKTLLKEMTDLTSNIMKLKGAIENVDKNMLMVYRKSNS